MTEAVFPPGFFERDDPSPDTVFYGPPRLVSHIDARAIAAVGLLGRRMRRARIQHLLALVEDGSRAGLLAERCALDDELLEQRDTRRELRV